MKGGISMADNKIAILRKEHGWNQKELADKLGVVQTTVSAWETGRSEPDNETLNNLSKLFHVSLGYVAGFERVRKDIPLTDEEAQALFDKQYEYHIMKEIEREEQPFSNEQIEELESQLLHEDFRKNGKGLFFEAFSFNKACEFMNQSQRTRALNGLKALFPNAFHSSYNPD